MSSRPHDEERDPATVDGPEADPEDAFAAVRSLEDARRQRLASQHDGVSRDTSPCLIIPGASMECPTDPPAGAPEPTAEAEPAIDQIEASSRDPVPQQWAVHFEPTFPDAPDPLGERLADRYFRLVNPIVHPLLWLMVLALAAASLVYVVDVKPRLARLRVLEADVATAEEEARAAPKIIDLATTTRLLQRGASFVALPLPGPLVGEAGPAEHEIIVGFVAPSERGGDPLVYVLEHQFRSVGVLPSTYDTSAHALERRQTELLGLLTPHLPPLALAPQLQPMQDLRSAPPSPLGHVVP